MSHKIIRTLVEYVQQLNDPAVRARVRRAAAEGARRGRLVRRRGQKDPENNR